MERLAAFLRGMNLGKRRLKNEELRAAFTALGFEGVHSFRASGNVAFAAPPGSLVELTARIEAGLAETLGYAVPTFLRTAEEVRRIAAHAPFDPELIGASAGKLQVMLLMDAPSSGARRGVLAIGDERDRLAFGERELYWLPSGGLLKSELDLKAIAALLGPSTTRTKGTIEQLAVKHFAS
jgi:uncharacterized protein (DUF1697 family)